MLYWAEGSKERNTLTFCNSDVNMLRYFRHFLATALDVKAEDFIIRLHVYTNNGIPIAAVERYWLDALDLPPTALRGHQINPLPTSSSGRKRNRLPYGVCTLTLRRSSRTLQHIYGAIQEYAGFDEPVWLDGPPLKPRPGKEPQATDSEPARSLSSS